MKPVIDRPAVILPFPPRPRRIDVHITAAVGREPLGRTRALRMTEHDLARLIEAAEMLEAAS